MNSLDRSNRNTRKKAVSIRMSRSDLQNVKRLAERLGARDSDVIRFAIKLVLSKLAPLQDPAVTGRSLVPVFLESGPELMRHFEIDSTRLASIFNDGVEEDRRVEPDDIQLIALSGIQRSYLRMRMEGVRRPGMGESQPTVDAGVERVSAVTGAASNDGEAVEQSLRQYLLEKYLYRGANRSVAGGAQ